MTTVENCLTKMEYDKVIDGQRGKEILSHLQSTFGITNNLCGFDAVTITKNTILQAVKRTNNTNFKVLGSYPSIYSFSRDDPIEVDISDLDSSISISSSYILSNLNKKKRPNIFNFDDLYGYDEIKNKLCEIFVWPSLYPDLFKKSPIKLQQGVLLYGLPGCGKSHLGLALANEVKMNFRMIKGPELLSKYIGASEEQVRALFDEARKNQPILLFFDEFDSLVPKRGHDNTGVTDRVVNQLLTEIDGVSGSNNSGIFILATSNRPDLIDPAILRPGRISGKIHCQLPSTVQAKVAAIGHFLRKSKIPISNEALSIWDYLDSKLDDPSWLELYSFADLLAIVKQAENNSVIRFDRSDDSSACEISLLDLKAALDRSRSSLTREQINSYLTAYEDLTSVPNRSPRKLKSTLA